jgi:uncharacterized protein YbjT (DUF2867 family)
MRVAVVGGTGTIGRRVVAALGRGGHEVRVLTRRAREYPVDLRTGAGIRVALEGCDVVVEASNGPPTSRARTVLVEGARRLLEAEQRVGVHHHVCVSIVGIEDVPFGYYRVKVEQESVVQQGGVAWSIVRSTQFHDLLGAMLWAAGRWHVLPAARGKFQPVDVAEAADAVAIIATGAPRLAHTTIAGPEVLDLRALGRLCRQTTGRHAIEVPVPLPRKLGRALRDGRLTCAEPDIRGTRTFAAWLKANAH